MLFISDEFLVFLLVVGGFMAVLRHRGARRWLLLAACVWFYASWSIGFLGLLLGNIVFDYVIALRLGDEVAPSRRKRSSSQASA
jgi:hypothetical protein